MIIMESGFKEEIPETKYVPVSDKIATEGEADREVPDGGWGWVVVMATLTFNVIYDGCSHSFGILYTDLLVYFGDTKSNTAWIGSLFFAVPLLCAPLAAFITKKLGSRKATMLGGFVASVGFAVGSVSNSVWMLIISYGLVGGFGMSLPYFNSLKTVTDYFDKRLALASGIAESGAGLGTVIFAPITEFLISKYGWRGTVLILSGIVANIIVCGALYRPLKRNKYEIEIPILPKIPAEEELCLNEPCLNSEVTPCLNGEVTPCLNGEAEPCLNGAEMINSMELTLKANAPRIIDEGKISKVNAKVFHHNRSRLRSIPFIIFAISNFTMYFWYDVPYVFMVDRSVSFGMGSQKASYLLSIIGFVHLVSILEYGILGDRNFVNRTVLYGLSTALCGGSILLVPFFNKFSALAILSGCFGMFSAATEALLSCVLIDIVGKEAFDNFFCGFILCMEGIANLIGPPFAGMYMSYYLGICYL